jgi:hypothetical protein
VIEVAGVPLKVTVLVPCAAPKFVPIIATEVPTTPEFGVSWLMAGAGTVTVNAVPALATPPTVTTTLPVVAPTGTTATIDVELQSEMDVAAVPLKVAVLVPCVEPKFVPIMATELPTRPEFGVRLVMAGVGGIAYVNKSAELVALVPAEVTTVTYTEPAPAGEIAVILVAEFTVKLVAAVVPKLTEVAPVKLVPTIVTEVPPVDEPVVGPMAVIVGAAAVPEIVYWAVATALEFMPGAAAMALSVWL